MEKGPFGLTAERLMDRDDIASYSDTLSRPLTVRLVSAVLEKLRRRAQEDPYYVPTEADAAALCVSKLASLDRRRLRPVLNASGVVLNGALGRSPVVAAAWDAARRVNVGYSNLEYEIETGNRRRRGGIVAELLSVLTGAEASLVVNNGSAAVLLSLLALGAGKEVLVARGDAVQIGGFRVPEIVALAGARMKEVGTANVTTVDDYLRAVGGDTAAVLLVNASNFVLRGFTRRPDPRALAAALPPELPIIVDQGTGAVAEPFLAESSVIRALGAGARLVCFSADKTLGGPQAGIVVGEAAFVARLAGHPLARAFRPGKTTLSLLEETLVERLGRGTEPAGPGTAVERAAAKMDAEASAELKAFGRKIVKRLDRDGVSLVPSRASVGGGAAPDEFVDSWAVELDCGIPAETVKRELRRGAVPIVPRADKDAARLDLLTLDGEDPKELAELIGAAIDRCRSPDGEAGHPGT